MTRESYLSSSLDCQWFEASSHAAITPGWANACWCGRSSRGIMMRTASNVASLHRRVLAGLLIGLIFLQSTAFAAGPLLIAYGGFNETMAPLWIGIERGLFHKYGVDVAVLQTRSGQIMMTTLATGGAALVWAAPSSAVSSSAAGMKLGCFAAGNNKLPRELIVRRGIETNEDLRGKTFGVQSIGGGAWLSTMVALDALGLDPDKYKLNMRVIGDTGTQTQAIVSGNIDDALLPYSYGEIAKRAGARSLADAGAMKIVYQATVMCSLKDSPIVNAETMTALVKGLIESLLYILEPGNKRDVAAVLKKNLRLSKDEDGEAAARVAQLQMPNIEVGLNLDAWKTVRRLVARINPKVQETDLDQVMVTSVVQHLEVSGFMAEMRKRLAH